MLHVLVTSIYVRIEVCKQIFFIVSVKAKWAILLNARFAPSVINWSEL